MAKAKKPHHHISLAGFHRNTIFPTFNAYIALRRAEDLLEDVEHLALVYSAAEETADRGRISGFAITDYYVVGYVTCLEWHARSRLVDLLTCMPQLIEPSAVRAIDVEAISQMPEVRVTLPDLLGVSAKINNLAAYTKVFDRVWGALKIATLLNSLLADAAKLAGGSRYLHELFERRHSLVHEVNITKVGSYLQRDVWTFEEAIAHGKMTVEIIRKIEREISSFAPDHFPNKLDSKGFPEDSITKLERKTQEIENRIAAAIDSERAAYFAKARIFAAESSKVQTDFVEAVLREIPKRYYDPGPAIQEMLHRHKLEFLTTIARELGV